MVDDLDGGARRSVEGPVPTRTSTGLPAGVWVRALLTRLPSTWRSRWSSPSTTRALPSSPSPSPVPRTSSIGRSGATARASVTASAARASRSTGSRPSGRCWSSRASSRRSSTSSPIRAASSSIRRMRRSSSAGSRPAPCRYSSAKPLMVVRGVRSSWLASATKRRIRSSERLAASSERRALASEAALAPKADSIWASMVLRARPSRPTSVRGSRSGTRRVRSPAAIAPAVCSISTSGRRLARTMAAPTAGQGQQHDQAHDQVDQPELAGGAVDPVEAGGHDHAAPVAPAAARRPASGRRRRLAGTVVTASPALASNQAGVVRHPGRLLALLEQARSPAPAQACRRRRGTGSGRGWAARLGPARARRSWAVAGRPSAGPPGWSWSSRRPTR